MTTPIEWTDETWNPVLGCSRVSSGCLNCYPIPIANIRKSNPNPKIATAYAGLTERHANGKLDWTGVVRLIPERLEQPLHWKKPRRIFVNSMSDLFHEGLSDEQIDRVFGLMGACDDAERGHVFQVLTKRPDRMLHYLKTRARAAWNSRRMNRSAFPPRNIWLGVSVEDQKTADERTPLLLETPAAVRFISAEPLLGGLEIKKYLRPRLEYTFPCAAFGEAHEWSIPRLDWVICGGESGPGARPMHPQWARSLRDQCQAARVPYFFKQWGQWAPISQLGSGDGPGCSDYYKNAKTCVLQLDGRREVSFPPGAMTMLKIGKSEAGRLLDGREWSEFPAVATR